MREALAHPAPPAHPSLCTRALPKSDPGTLGSQHPELRPEELEGCPAGGECKGLKEARFLWDRIVDRGMGMGVGPSGVPLPPALLLISRVTLSKSLGLSQPRVLHSKDRPALPPAHTLQAHGEHCAQGSDKAQAPALQAAELVPFHSAHCPGREERA